jgi:hypothetical protein
MAETRQIGKLTIHFLGDNAAQSGNSFADARFAGVGLLRASEPRLN